jgi:hypothetical protein
MHGCIDRPLLGNMTTNDPLMTHFFFFLLSSTRLFGLFRFGINSQWYSVGLRGICSGVRVSVGVWNFCLHHRVQTGSGAHQASYPMGPRSSFPGDKAVGA